MSAQQRTPDEIRREIDATREHLAQTAAALAEKADVRARAHEKVDETKARVQDAAEAAPVSPAALVAIAAGALLLLVLLRRRRT